MLAENLTLFKYVGAMYGILRGESVLENVMLMQELSKNWR